MLKKLPNPARVRVTKKTPTTPIRAKAPKQMPVLVKQMQKIANKISTELKLEHVYRYVWKAGPIFLNAIDNESVIVHDEGQPFENAGIWVLEVI